jgi:hypothetical protein
VKTQQNIRVTTDVWTLTDKNYDSSFGSKKARFTSFLRDISGIKIARYTSFVLHLGATCSVIILSLWPKGMGSNAYKLISPMALYLTTVSGMIVVHIAQWIACWCSLGRMLSSPICGEYAAVCTGSILGVHRDSFAISLPFGSLITIYAKPNKTLNIRRVWVSIGFELGHCERLIIAR